MSGHGLGQGPPEHHPLFVAALPKDPRVETMKMFGGLAAKVNGHIFAGLFGQGLRIAHHLLARPRLRGRGQPAAQGGEAGEEARGRQTPGGEAVRDA